MGKTMINKIKIPKLAYCLTSNPERKKSVEKFLNRTLGSLEDEIEIIYITGPDKHSINLTQLEEQGLIKPYRNINQGRVACHLGHIDILKTFLKTKEERCMIFEDDIYAPLEVQFPDVKDIFKSNFKKVYENMPDDYDILWLGFCWEWCKYTYAINDYVYVPAFPLCRHAYSVNRFAARQIIKHTLPMTYHGDNLYANLIRRRWNWEDEDFPEDFRSHIEKKLKDGMNKPKSILKAYASRPPLFYQNRKDFTSDLDNNNQQERCKCQPVIIPDLKIK